MNYSENTSPLSEKVRKQEAITFQEYADAVDKFTSGLKNLYDMAFNLVTPEMRDLIYRISKEMDDLTGIICSLPLGDLRESSRRKYLEATKVDPNNKGFGGDNHITKAACTLINLLNCEEK